MPLTRDDVEPGLRASARQVSLLRLLLLAIALGVLTLSMEHGHGTQVEPALTYLRELMAAVMMLSGLLAFTVKLVRRRWQLSLHLVFDLLWTALLVHFSGGVNSPGVVILFVVILIGTLSLPGAIPFVLPSLASLFLAGSAVLYVSKNAPYPETFLAANPSLIDANRVIGLLATQVAALFVVDLLGQLLARRINEQRIFTGVLLDQLGEGVLAVDRQGLIVYINAEAFRLLDLEQANVQGKQAATVLTGPQLAPLLSLLREQSTPVLQRISGPSERELMLRCTELLGRHRKPIGRTLLIADETRLRILEDSARRAEHLSSLGEMAAAIAHEVRNPLTSLRGCAQELAEINEKANNQDATDLATILVNESDRLARIVDDFLTLSRMRKPQLEAVDFAPMFKELGELYERQSDLPRGLHVDFVVAEKCPPVAADAGQIRQIVTNLVNNAIDAVRNVGIARVTVTARLAPSGHALDGTAVEIAVVDNGCGIPPELQEEIFTPFFSTKSQGTGLGLSLVQRIVKEHEGVLQLASQTGAGTTVTIFLPVHTQTRTYMRALGAT